MKKEKSKKKTSPIKNKQNPFKKFFRFCLKIGLILFVSSLASVIILRWLPVPFTPLMGIRIFEQWSDGDKIIFKKDWEPINNISPNLQLAVIAAEDQNFLNHYGFDLKAIENALKNNKKKNKKTTKGASTISQQVAKNVFLWPGRSYLRKGLEVYFTCLIELIWNKERILEVYLNVIELGNGIYGAEAASIEYFNTPSLKTSKAQAAALAAVLPNPRKYSVKKPSNYISGRKNWILKQMNNIGEVNFD